MPNDPLELVIDEVVNHDDGSATLNITFGEEARDSILSLGFELVFFCAAYSLDIQHAFDVLRDYSELQQGDSDD